jgi:ATP/ADP translocase
MYKKVLAAIEGIDIYPVITLIIFFTFFVLWLVYVMKLKKSYIDRMSDMPLSDDDSHQNLTRNEAD